MPSKINVLCITDYFIPGYLGGGPITTLVNMRNQIKEQITLSIFTRDRDLGCKFQYPNISTDQWTESKAGPIYYASPKTFGPKGVLSALASGKFDLIYLNSFFSPRASILPLIVLRRSKPNIRILLAPRGEFSSGALSIKRYKKMLFLAFARLSGFYNSVFWHASTSLEAADIERTFPSARGRILVAADPVIAEAPDVAHTAESAGQFTLRMAFISRISEMKNLDGLLQILSTVSSTIQLDIIGPVEDNAYWKRCNDLIHCLPENIQVNARGPIAHHLITNTFSQYDLFAFPTHGENFGHVIFEALRAGTPVIVSDQTPWKADGGGALTVIPLADISRWRMAIERAAGFTLSERRQLRHAARAYAISYASNSNTKKENLMLFSKVINY